MAKVVQISDDSGVSLFTFPGSTADQNRDADPLNDTVFGQTFGSTQTGLITGGISANGFYKGFAGYVADIKKQGTTTGMATEAMTLVSGKIYQIDDTTKRIWDRAFTSWVVFDNAVNHNADVLNFDFLFGRVTFKAAYVVTGPVTITGSYFPTVVIGKARTFSLTMTAETKDISDLAAVQANGGFRTFDPGLRTVALELGAVHDAAATFKADLTARSEFVIELNPDGNGKSVARGFFKLTSYGQSGDVGALEEESLTFNLSVPDPADTFVSEIPFKWVHAVDTTLSTAVQKALTAWEAETKPEIRYLPDGTTGDKYTSVVVTEASLSGGLEAMNEFSFSFQGDGAPTAI